VTGLSDTGTYKVCAERGLFIATVSGSKDDAVVFHVAANAIRDASNSSLVAKQSSNAKATCYGFYLLVSLQPSGKCAGCRSCIFIHHTTGCVNNILQQLQQHEILPFDDDPAWP